MIQSSDETSIAPSLDTNLLAYAKGIAAQFSFKDDDTRRCAGAFVRELELGLRQRTPSMCQIPTYVTRVATGLEKGISLGLDLGGTNLRVCSVDLHGDTTSTVLQSQVPVPRDLMVAKTSRELFGFIAKHIQDFLTKYHPNLLKITCNDHHPFFPLGFTFSFPAYQAAINSGILLRWTKGYDIPDAVGQDVCKFLQDEIDLLKLPVRITALVNDAVGTIVSRAYSLPPSAVRPSIGAIFGTGTNGVYLQDISDITKTLGEKYDQSTGKMFLSTEWGSFENKLAVLPSTSYDVDLNEHSVKPGNQMFEKRVAGMFLGELLRLALAEMYHSKDIQLFRAGNQMFNKTDSLRNISIPLQRRWMVDSSILSVAEADTSETLAPLSQKIHEALGIQLENINVEDAKVVKVLAHAIGTRAARLAGMAVGSVIVQSKLLNPTTVELIRKGEIAVDVSVDGSVVEHYPAFERSMRESLRAIHQIGDAGEKGISIGHAKDGSSVGAAIIALLATPGVTPAASHS